MADTSKHTPIPKRPIVHSILLLRNTMATHPKFIHSLAMGYKPEKSQILKLIKQAKFIRKFLHESELKETIAFRKHAHYLISLQPVKYDFATLSCFPKIGNLRLNVELLDHWRLICSRRNLISLSVEVESSRPDSKRKVKGISKTLFSRKLERLDHMLKRDKTLKIISIQGEVSILVSDLLNTVAKSLPCLSSDLKLSIKSGSEWEAQDAKGELTISKDLLRIIYSISIKKAGPLMDLLKGSSTSNR